MFSGGRGQVLSLMVAAGYLVFAGVTDGGEGLATMLLFVLFPLAGIWFPDVLENCVGGLTRYRITQKSPAVAVSFLSWVILLAPLFAYGIAAVT